MSNLINQLINGDAHERTISPVTGRVLPLREVWTVADVEALRADLDTEALDRVLTAALDTFECACGEHAWPLYDDTADESTWCECGLRIADQRTAHLYVIDQLAATR